VMLSGGSLIQVVAGENSYIISQHVGAGVACSIPLDALARTDI
jgi:hypothetical protein